MFLETFFIFFFLMNRGFLVFLICCTAKTVTLETKNVRSYLIELIPCVRCLNITIPYFRSRLVITRKFNHYSSVHGIRIGI